MDPARFDSWTRNRALRLSRRSALKLAGAGVLVAESSRVAAQPGCSWAITGEALAGPSALATYAGTLEFSIGAQGTLENATFTPAGGAPVPATGVVTGRAVDLQVALSPGQTLVFSGASSAPVVNCQGLAGGILAGPQPGDIGAWQADAGGSAPTGQVSTANSASGCPPPQLICGANCCPGGSVCTDAANGLCACPDNAIQCGLNCVALCPEGQDLDLDRCICIAGSNCLDDQVACFSDEECCSGFCTNGECRSCGGLMCNGSCIDPNLDNQNCGGCGISCDGVLSCVSGTCSCAPDGSPCEFTDQCCSLLCGSNGFCGCVQLGEACGSTGDCCGNATDGQLCVNGICVFPNGHACSSGAQCFGGECTNGICS